MKKSLSCLTAVLLLAFILAVTLTLSLEADHVCDGDDCPVCALLDCASRLLISGAPPSSAAARGVPPQASAAASSAETARSRRTPSGPAAETCTTSTAT